MLQVWPLTSGPQSSPLLALAAAWTLPLVLAALWALCLVPLTGMLHPRPLVQVGLACGLFVAHARWTAGTTCSGLGDAALRRVVDMGRSLLHPWVLMDLCCGQSAFFWYKASWLGWSLQLSSPRARSALQHSFHQMSATCCILTVCSIACCRRVGCCPTPTGAGWPVHRSCPEQLVD